MRAIDTNVLVRLLTRDDAGQTARAESFIATGAWISHPVLIETVWVLESVFGLDPSGIATSVGMLLEHAQLVIQDPDVVGAALRSYRAHDGVEFSDCLILESARKAGHLPLGTFDRAFSRLEGAERI
jgi:predicted nucleic-acid-binding protein